MAYSVAEKVDPLKPVLKEPFPRLDKNWVCNKTGLIVPKTEGDNLNKRSELLEAAENDLVLQNDLMSACSESLLFWVNMFVWTYHQFDVDPITGKRIEARNPHVPFITWEIQDRLFDEFEYCLKNAEDILIDKSRDMGASWCCIAFMHWLWLFNPGSQLLEMSRTEDYVDKSGNMKALFQKHDYINAWLPEWMLPPECLYGQSNRTKEHMININNGSCIDGESTTEHASSGDRRKVILLDEFAKVKNGTLMRSATRDAGLIRIVNSTPGMPGTEYSNWKNSGQIKVFIMPYYEHPEKGSGRYVRRTESGDYEIRSPWFDHEETIRSPNELAKEILRKDLAPGSVFFTDINVDKHMAMFARESVSRCHVHFKKKISNDSIKDLIRARKHDTIQCIFGSKGPLRLWVELINGRPDQSKTYIFGIDISKGHGSSESVVSIKCKETSEKIGEWRDGITPPHDMARIVIALAMWCGGANPRRLPFLKWEKNGPGLDFGKIIVKEYQYPYFYRQGITGQTMEKKSEKYGWHSSREAKHELLALYDRKLAHGGYINHSTKALEQVKLYVNYDGGGIGPAFLVKESETVRAAHGDIVIADALTLDDKEVGKAVHKGPKAPVNSFAYRREQKFAKMRKPQGWQRQFNFTKA